MGTNLATQVFTAASVDLSASASWARIMGGSDPSDTTPFAQILQLSATANQSSGSATLSLRWYDEDQSKVIKTMDFTIAVTAVRTVLTGASGDYVCTVTSAIDGTDKADVMPMDNKVRLYVGLSALTTITALSVSPKWTRSI